MCGGASLATVRLLKSYVHEKSEGLATELRSWQGFQFAESPRIMPTTQGQRIAYNPTMM